MKFTDKDLKTKSLIKSKENIYLFLEGISFKNAYHNY